MTEKTDKKENLAQFSERLKAIIPVGSGREFARKAGISYSTLHNYLQGVSSPTLENLVAIAGAAHASIEWLATGKEFQGAVLAWEIQHSRTSKIPFLENEKFLFLDLGAFPSLHAWGLAALQVDNNTMEPTFRVGSILIIDTARKELKEGKVVVMRKGRDYLIKRVQAVSEGFRLSSDNDKYSPIIVTNESIDSFEMLGEVVLTVGQLV